MEYLVSSAKLIDWNLDTLVIEQELVRAFYLDRTEEQAAIQIKKLIESGVLSVKRMLKNATHELSGNIK